MAQRPALAEQVALSVGQGSVSEETASELQQALPDVSFLSVDVKADAEGRVLAGVGNLMVAGPKNLALMTPDEVSHPDRALADEASRLTPLRLPLFHVSPESAQAAQLNPFAGAGQQPQPQPQPSSPIAFLQAYILHPAGSVPVRDTELALRQLADQLQTCLKQHSDVVADSAYIFALGRPAPAPTAAQPPAAQQEAAEDPAPTAMHGVEHSSLFWPGSHGMVVGSRKHLSVNSSQPAFSFSGLSSHGTDGDSASFRRGRALCSHRQLLEGAEGKSDTEAGSGSEKPGSSRSRRRIFAGLSSPEQDLWSSVESGGVPSTRSQDDW